MICTNTCNKKSVGEIEVDHEKCIGCQTCAAVCPEQNYRIEPGEDQKMKSFVKRDYICTACRSCEMACPVDAIVIKDID